MRLLAPLIAVALALSGCNQLHISEQNVATICANAQIVGTSASQISQVFADAGVEQHRAGELAQKAMLATNIAAAVCAILEQIRFEEEKADPNQNANQPVV